MSAYRSAEPTTLGPLIAEHQPTGVGRILVPIVVVVIGLLIDLAAFGSPPRTFNHWAIVLVFGVLAPVFGLLTLFGRQPDTVRVHELGIVTGSWVLPWTEIAELKVRRYVGGRRTTTNVLDRYWLRTRGGETVELRCGNVDLDALLATMRKGTLEPLLAEARSTLESGGKLTFGKLTWDGATLASPDSSIARASIDSATFEGLDHAVVVKGRGSAWIELPLEDVPNAHVLLALLG